MATATEKTKAKGKKGTARVQIGIVVDESGSMAPNRDSVIEGINGFVSELAGDEANQSKDLRATLVQFDSTGHEEWVRTKFTGKKLAQVDPLTAADYVPRGGTPLNDAIGQTIGTLEKAAKKRDKVMLVIFTDGLENQSREFTTEKIRDLILQKEKDGWAFIYLGANQDAWAEGGARGLGSASSQGFTSSPVGTANALRSTTKRAAAFAKMSQDSYARASANMAAATGGKLPENEVLNLADYAGDDERKAEAEAEDE